MEALRNHFDRVTWVATTAAATRACRARGARSTRRGSPSASLMASGPSDLSVVQTTDLLIGTNSSSIGAAGADLIANATATLLCPHDNFNVEVRRTEYTVRASR